jgi:hypothetical protein
MNVLGGGGATADGGGAAADGGGTVADPVGAAAVAVGAVGVEDRRINGRELGVGRTTVTGREGDAIMGTGVSAGRGVSSGMVAGDGDGATKGVRDGVGAATTGVGVLDSIPRFYSCTYTTINRHCFSRLCSPHHPPSLPRWQVRVLVAVLLWGVLPRGNAFPNYI